MRSLFTLRLSAPTFGEIDIELSFRMTIRFVPRWPAWFRPSKAMPAVMAPSPITAITWWSSPRRSRAAAMPVAAEIDVPAWPAPKRSWGLSLRSANPERPSYWRIVSICSRRPVTILWTYTWWLTSQSMRSLGESNCRCSASVSSTTPRFEARWPPPPIPWIVLTSSSRISPASCSNSLDERARRSSGESILSSKRLIGSLLVTLWRE